MKIIVIIIVYQNVQLIIESKIGCLTLLYLNIHCISSEKPKMPISITFN